MPPLTPLPGVPNVANWTRPIVASTSNTTKEIQDARAFVHPVSTSTTITASATNAEASTRDPITRNADRQVATASSHVRCDHHDVRWARARPNAHTKITPVTVQLLGLVDGMMNKPRGTRTTAVVTTTAERMAGARTVNATDSNATNTMALTVRIARTERCGSSPTKTFIAR